MQNLRSLRPIVALFLSLTGATGSLAVSIPITNAGFENPVTPPDSFITNAAPSGWTTFGAINHSNRAVGVLNPATTTLYTDPVPEGSNVGVVFLLDGSAASPAGLQQTLGSTLQTNTVYTLRVEVGNIANDSRAPFQFNGFPGYRVDLLAGGVVLASDQNTLAPAEGRFLGSVVTASIGASHALAGQALGIRLVNLDGANGIEVNFDHVRLDATAIPEPASAAALAAGLALLACATRRRSERRI